MDGASKFVKGDAIAAIVITTINLVGGMIVGVLQHHMPISQAVSTYSLLSVGDGLVSQIPALLISISAGLIVTRAATEADLGTDVLQQLGRQTQAIRLAGIVVALLAVIPGLPKLPFLLVGGGLVLIATRSASRKAPEPEPEEVTGPPADSPRRWPGTCGWSPSNWKSRSTSWPSSTRGGAATSWTG